MNPEILYYLASPEASALIGAAFKDLAAYKAAVFAMRDRIGATTAIESSGRCVGFGFKGGPMPEGWTKPAKRLRFPPGSGVGPKGWDSELPPFPSFHALDKALGVGDFPPKSFIKDGKLYSAMAGYGYERVGETYVITMQSVNGEPIGNPPAGCQPLKKSEYYALKGE